MRKITKLFTTVAKSIDESTKTVRFKISDNQLDRMGERVDQASWDFKDYMNNPVVLWGHNPDEPENVLGTAKSVEVQGDATFAEMSFDEDINPKAALVWKQILKGTLRTVSVGFISERSEGDTLFDNKLLEISVVPIPANPRAIALSYQAGEISRKDATWLKQSMEAEIKHIDEKLKEGGDDDMTQKDVAELEAKLNTVLDAVSQIGERVAELGEAVASPQTAAKTEGEADTESDDKAAENGSSDHTEHENTDDTSAEGDDDAAKDGENDQSGAATDIDFDAELTPEIEAQIEAELASDDSQ